MLYPVQFQRSIHGSSLCSRLRLHHRAHVPRDAHMFTGAVKVTWPLRNKMADVRVAAVSRLFNYDILDRKEEIDEVILVDTESI